MYDIVTINERNEIGVCIAYSDISRATATALNFILNKLDSTILECMMSDDFCATVRRVIVNANDFYIRK